MPDTPKAYKLNKEASGGGYLQATQNDGRGIC
ncbi:unknown [Acidiphilium sp. CAG:727]|nr:unknown [Acidiphilium sp. CAG:727]